MDTKPPACGSELVSALPNLVADGPRDVPGSDRANLDLSSTIADLKSGPSHTRDRALLARPGCLTADAKRWAKSILLAGVLVNAVSGWGAANASECGACDHTITFSRIALECLSRRIDDLVEDARATNPLLINLSECPDDRRGPASNGSDRGELPQIPGVPRDPIGENRTTELPRPSPPANFAILSLRQLECLKQNLNTLAADADEPARFDFDVCDGP
jgi:hypothetical protein